eukprot:7358925-Prymnesium_polylepis.1
MPSRSKPAWSARVQREQSGVRARGGGVPRGVRRLRHGSRPQRATTNARATRDVGRAHKR